MLDEFGLKPLSQPELHDLLEVIEDRHGLHSTILTSQLLVYSLIGRVCQAGEDCFYL